MWHPGPTIIVLRQSPAWTTQLSATRTTSNVCANGINSGKYAYNNLQHYDATWYHKFNAKWHTATEA
jgi:hypothetical protein